MKMILFLASMISCRRNDNSSRTIIINLLRILLFSLSVPTSISFTSLHSNTNNIHHSSFRSNNNIHIHYHDERKRRRISFLSSSSFVRRTFSSSLLTSIVGINNDILLGDDEKDAYKNKKDDDNDNDFNETNEHKNSNNDNDSIMKMYQSCNNLSRLYVGPELILNHDDNSKQYNSNTNAATNNANAATSNDDTNRILDNDTTLSKQPQLPQLKQQHHHQLTKNIRIQLTHDQSHYIVNVMRLGGSVSSGFSGGGKGNGRRKKKKRKKRKQIPLSLVSLLLDIDTNTNDNDKMMTNNNNDNGYDWNDFVRIFDGRNGEWLAQIVNNNDNDNIVTLKCVLQLRNQYGKRTLDLNPSKSASITGTTAIPTTTSLLSSSLLQPAPWLFYAPLNKRHRTKLLIEKCTEIGCGLFRSIHSERTTSTASSSSAASSLFDASSSESFLYDSTYSSPSSYVVESSSSSSSSSSLIEYSKWESSLRTVAQGASEQCERLDIPIFCYDSLFSTPTPTTAITTTVVGGVMTTNSNMQNLLEDWITTPTINHHDEKKDAACASQQYNYYQQEKQERILLICRERGNGNALPVMNVLSELYLSNNNNNNNKNPKNNNNIPNKKKHEGVVFLIGPEGGWSIDEEELFNHYCLKYPNRIKSISLGSNVLRAETAGIMAMGSYALVKDCI